MNETKTTALATIASAITSRAEAYAASLPAGVRVERFIRQILTAVQANPKLMQCTPSSLVLASMQIAQAGLEVDPTMREAALVPRMNRRKKVYEAHMIATYQGLAKLAMRHPLVISISSDVVHQGDVFRVSRGAHPDLVHEPLLRGERGPIIGAYAVAFLREGHPIFEFLTTEQIESIRARVPYSTEPDSPWVTHWPEMARKTAVRRLWKSLPRVADDGGLRSAMAGIEDREAELEAAEAQEAARATISELPVVEVGGEPDVQGEEPPHERVQAFVRAALAEAGAATASKARAWLSERLGRAITGIADLTPEDVMTLAGDFQALAEQHGILPDPTIDEEDR